MQLSRIFIDSLVPCVLVLVGVGWRIVTVGDVFYITTAIRNKNAAPFTPAKELEALKS